MSHRRKSPWGYESAKGSVIDEYFKLQLRGGQINPVVTVKGRGPKKLSNRKNPERRKRTGVIGPLRINQRVGKWGDMGGVKSDRKQFTEEKMPRSGKRRDKPKKEGKD